MPILKPKANASWNRHLREDSAHQSNEGGTALPLGTPSEGADRVLSREAKAEQGVTLSWTSQTEEETQSYLQAPI